MVMSWIWTGIVLISILCALVLGNGSALAAATVSGAQAGIQLALSMDRASCIPACAPLTVAAASALPLPRTSAQRMLIRTMPVHIQLMTMRIPPLRNL